MCAKIWQLKSTRANKLTFRNSAFAIALLIYCHGPTKSYESVKRIIRASWNNDLKSQLNLEASEQGKCGKSRDFREGVLAFVEKRTPNFEGR